MELTEGSEPRFSIEWLSKAELGCLYYLLCSYSGVNKDVIGSNPFAWRIDFLEDLSEKWPWLEKEVCDYGHSKDAKRKREKK